MSKATSTSVHLFPNGPSNGEDVLWYQVELEVPVMFKEALDRGDREAWKGILSTLDKMLHRATEP